MEHGYCSICGQWSTNLSPSESGNYDDEWLCPSCLVEEDLMFDLEEE